jgi:hypothetical protein
VQQNAGGPLCPAKVAREAQSLQWETDFQQLVTAHLDFPLAESQLERAFKRLYENQNLDGT